MWIIHWICGDVAVLCTQATSCIYLDEVYIMSYALSNTIAHNLSRNEQMLIIKKSDTVHWMKNHAKPPICMVCVVIHINCVMHHKIKLSESDVVWYTPTSLKIQFPTISVYTRWYKPMSSWYWTVRTVQSLVCCCAYVTYAALFTQPHSTLWHVDGYHRLNTVPSNH